MKKLSKRVKKEINKMLTTRLNIIIELEENEMFRTAYKGFLKSIY